MVISHFRKTKGLKKEFLVNIFLLVLVNVLVKPFYLFGIDRKVQVLVGTEDFGYYIAIFNFTLILQFINDFGLQAWTNRAIGQQTEKVRESYGEIISVRLQLTLIYLLLTILLGVLWFGSSLNVELFIRLCINQVLISGILFFRAQISGLGFYKTDSLLSIMDRLILILLCFAFLYSDRLLDNVSISWFVNMQSISLLLVLMITISLLYRKKFHFSPTKFHWPQTLFYLKSGFPFAMIYLMYAAMTKMDAIWLGKLLQDGYYRSGQFAASMRLYEAASMISLAFGSLLISMFARGISDLKKNEELLKTSISVLLVISMAIALGVSVLSTTLNQMLYPGSNEEWDLVLEILMWAFVPASINFIFGAYFQATHRENELWKLYGFAFILSSGLNLVLIPGYHVIASAFIFLIVQTALMFVQFYKAEIAAERNRSFFFSILVFILICVLGFFGLRQIGLSMLLLLLSIFLTMLLALYFSQLFRTSDFKKFVEWVRERNKTG